MFLRFFDLKIHKQARLFFMALPIAGSLLFSGCLKKGGPGDVKKKAVKTSGGGPPPALSFKKSETFYNNLRKEPATLHPIKSSDYYASIVHGHIFESLLDRNPETYKWEPQLAEKWEVSPDGQTFTFYLYKGLKWSDGRPLTAEDVKFSLEAYKNPEYGGAHLLPYYEKIKSAEIIDERTIAFKVKEPYFGNFQSAAWMDVIPRHVYQDPKTKLSKTAVGSGPYKIARYIRGKMLVLEQNPLWTGRERPHNQGKWLFQNIAFRFLSAEADILLRMQKNDLDYSKITAESFEGKTNEPPWGVSINKVKVKNKTPKGYHYVGLNLQKPIFQDRKVRQALAHLMNRDFMNKKFLFGYGQPASGPWYSWSDFASPSVKPFAFDPKKAAALLKAAGWEDQNQDGVLERVINGKTASFAFTLVFSRKDSEKYMTLYQEDLKKAGIKMSLKNIDFASLLRLLDNKDFDAAMLGWGGGAVDLDPRQIWHSESARKGGSNYISYSNPEADRLMEKGSRQMDRKARIKTFRKLYRLIAEDAPYIFMFNSPYEFYGANQRIKTPKPSCNYSLCEHYWSFQSGG